MSDFNDFILYVVPIVGRKYFRSMKGKTFCEVCSIEINKALFYSHTISKENNEIEHYLVRKGMTYCEICEKEIRNDEWREHNISEKHFNIEKKGYCKVCKEKYCISDGNHYSSYKNKCKRTQENHNRTEKHKKNQERFDLYFG